jgi:hypothetical protein
MSNNSMAAMTKLSLSFSLMAVTSELLELGM